MSLLLSKEPSCSAVTKLTSSGSRGSRANGRGRGARSRRGREENVQTCATARSNEEGVSVLACGRREAFAFATAGILGLSTVALPHEASALGPENVMLDIIDYKDTECSEGAPKGARCVEFRATSDFKSKKPAYNGEIFGKIRYKGSGESAIYGDFAEATDAGKIGDIDEIQPGKTEVKFTLFLQPGKTEDELEFINPKVRVYPGMRKDFRIMKPVSDTMDVCDPDYDLCD